MQGLDVLNEMFVHASVDVDERLLLGVGFPFFLTALGDGVGCHARELVSEPVLKDHSCIREKMASQTPS